MDDGKSMAAAVPAASTSADLGDEAVRRRLGPTAWKACHRLMEIWQVPAEQFLQLLDLPVGVSLDDVDPAQLSEEQMLRMAALIRIYEGLHILHCDELADEWVRLPNTNVMFGGITPLAYMLQGGIGAVRNVRRLIDARCAGN